MRVSTVVLSLICLILLFISPVPVGGQGRIGESDDFTGIFLIRAAPSIRVSIEQGWEKNGWIPVVLAVGNLELYFRMNKEGEVTGVTNVTGKRWRVDPDNAGIRVGGANLPFTIYEQNPLRTRMRLTDNAEPVLLAIDREKKQAVFYIGSSGWRVENIRVSLGKAGPGGLYKLTFGGGAVHTHGKLFLEPAAGNIYAVKHRRGAFNIDINSTPVWGVKVYKEELKEIDQGGFK
ncbi:MAG: hypothetical protein GY940_12480 [bacterium]|nr:hypothetical protein [bacterium]